MILKQISTLSKSFIANPKFLFAQPTKKRTEAPKTLKKQSQKIDPNKIDYNKIPEEYRKGVKSYVQATNMMVASEADIENLSLKSVILEERQKFQNSLNSIGQSTKIQNKDESNQKQQQQNDINYYDLTKAIKFMSYVSSALLASNALGYIALNSFKKFELLGFFLGVSLNPSLIALTGISVGFNCATWIIRQSLHLQIKDSKQLTIDKISLTGCSNAMYIQGLLICVQVAALSMYLMNSNRLSNFQSLIIAFILSQGHMIYNVIRATGGYKFELFSKLLLTFIFSTFLIGIFTYQLHQKIDQCKKVQVYGEDEKIKLSQNFQLKKGFERYLSELKTQEIRIFSGQKINKLTSDTL